MKEYRKWLKVTAQVAAIILVVYALIFFANSLGMAEEAYTQAWIICQPNDYINARSKPSGNSKKVGWFDPGDEILLDGQKKNGYLHCVGRFETDAWVFSGYVVYEEPVRVNVHAYVISKGDLQARKYVGGKRRCWLKTGDELEVRWWTSDWCVTNKGFVMTKFLEMEGV